MYSPGRKATIGYHEVSPDEVRDYERYRYGMYILAADRSNAGLDYVLLLLAVLRVSTAVLFCDKYQAPSMI